MKITQAETQAQVAGRLGGCVISAAKQKAAKLNGAFGGRPKKFEKQTPPTFGYPGGKAHLARTLVDLMPPSGRRYVEPFAGRGNVFWVASELDYQEWHINDIRTASWFEAIRDHGHDLKVPQCTRMEYYKRWAAYKNGCPYANMLEPLIRGVVMAPVVFVIAKKATLLKDMGKLSEWLSTYLERPRRLLRGWIGRTQWWDYPLTILCISTRPIWGAASAPTRRMTSTTRS
jgi:hypothetical protein